VVERLRFAIVGLALIVPVVTAAANPSWAVALGVDVWNLPDVQEQARTAAEHEQELESEYIEIRSRIDAKEELIHGLIAGRSGLAEVAAQFTVLNEGYEEHLAVIRQTYPGATDEEKMLWNVVEFVDHRVGDLPHWQRLAVMTRIHSELRTLSAEFAAERAN
jgi:hypothetical protein